MMKKKSKTRWGKVPKTSVRAVMKLRDDGGHQRKIMLLGEFIP